MKRPVAFLCIVVALFVASSCGSSSSPITPTPPVSPISGDWLGEETVASLSGGECLTSALQKDLVGYPSQFSGSFTQAGARVTATLDIDHTGAVCTYSGTIDGSALNMDMTSCTSTHSLAVSCPEGGARDLLLQAEHVAGTIAGDRITGTFTEMDAMFVSGSRTSVGTLGTIGSFTLMRR